MNLRAMPSCFGNSQPHDDRLAGVDGNVALRAVGFFKTTDGDCGKKIQPLLYTGIEIPAARATARQSQPEDKILCRTCRV